MHYKYSSAAFFSDMILVNLAKFYKDWTFRLKGWGGCTTGDTQAGFAFSSLLPPPGRAYIFASLRPIHLPVHKKISRRPCQENFKNPYLYTSSLINTYQERQRDMALRRLDNLSG